MWQITCKKLWRDLTPNIILKTRSGSSGAAVGSDYLLWSHSDAPKSFICRSSTSPSPCTHTCSPMQRRTPNHVDTVCQCRGWARPRDENSVNMGRQQGASLSPHAAPNKQTGRFRDFAGAQLCSIGSGSFSDVFRGAAYGILFLAYEVPVISCVSFVNSITILESSAFFSLCPSLDLTLQYLPWSTYCLHFLLLTFAIDLYHSDKPAESLWGTLILQLQPFFIWPPCS